MATSSSHPSASISMQIISGKVSELMVKRGRINLLKGLQTQAAFASVANFLSNDFGAASASVAMYDGEEVEHMGCLIDGKVFVGTFCDIDIKNGDHVQAIVHKLNDEVFFIDALIRISDWLLWMPFNITCGRQALAKSVFKLMRLGFVGSMILLILIVAFSTKWEVALLYVLVGLAGGMALLLSLAGLGVYKDGLNESLYAEKIFKTMSLRDPERIDLSSFSIKAKNRYLSGSAYVFNLREIIAKHGKLKKI